MSAPMVRAILAGTKTQTRRLAVLVLDGETTGDGHTTMGYEPDPKRGWGRAKTGDRLWVRETWALTRHYDSIPPAPSSSGGWKTMIRFRANDVHEGALLDWGRWRPSIHMPRWASRVDLEITSIRAERLQDISEEDARAEGVDKAPASPLYAGIASHREAFAALWDAINGERAPWASNPWVWVVGFKRIKP